MLKFIVFGYTADGFRNYLFEIKPKRFEWTMLDTRAQAYDTWRQAAGALAKAPDREYLAEGERGELIVTANIVRTNELTG
jgi:hypothetical protein